MSGAVFVLCTCYCCKRPMVCSPSKVPSIPRNLTTTGEKEPVCRRCMEHANRERIKLGHEPHPIQPGAYEPDEVA